ncbi:2-hydroxychromene-2-carboxylate isomerase [Piscinibacter sakaiensis]|uniref:2-hydroxychromene-2-carboxylate isomerase n=1 Tax=Piscinibacter sakaiensis TaxID=1547922 RepID=UPI003AB00CF3
MTANLKTVEFFFDFGSPTSYLAHTQLPTIAREAGARLIHRPMLLGGVFKATGNASPVSVAAKARWMASDLALWAKHYGVPFLFNPHFPINTLSLMRAAAGVQMEEAEDFEQFVDVVFRAMWVDGRNLADPEVFAEVMGKAGFNVSALLDLSLSPEVKQRLLLHTEEAVARGVFGAPTMFVGEQMFFGQDRLPFVRQALQAG